MGMPIQQQTIPDIINSYDLLGLGSLHTLSNELSNKVF